MKIGQKIRCARLLARLDQSELATKVGCSRNHISSLENDKSLPSLELWMRLCKVLKIDEHSYL